MERDEELKEDASKPRPRGRFRTSFVTPIVLVALVLIALGASRGSGYRRFVSKPLPDGTRYTFLYPEYLTNISENGKGASPSVTATVNISTRFSAQPVMNRFLSWLHMAPSATSDRVSALVIPHRGGPLLKQARHSKEHGGGAVWFSHAETIDDERTQTQFVLAYMCDGDREDQYKSHHLAVASSFRVLPPGAPEPNP